MRRPDPVTTLDADDVARLRDDFERAGYTADGVLERIGDAGQRGLHRNATLPAARALGEATDPLATLIRLFVLQQPVTAADAAAALSGGEAIRSALLERTRDESNAGREGAGPGESPDQVPVHPRSGRLPQPLGRGRVGELLRARIDVRPYASDDGASGWVASDLVTTLDTAHEPARPDFVLGVSPASTTLAQLAVRRPVAAALDLGTGCGVQSLHLARHAARVVATDVNPRALDLTRFTARLNGVDLDVREGSLYEPVAGQRFDLILTNPPYVMSPPRSAGERLTYREAGLPGDELMRRVVTEADRHLADGGVLQVLGNWAHVRGQDWRERLASWIAPDCDALVLQREVLDPYEYAELWLADAGLAGTPAYLSGYAEWVDYFDGLGVEAIGLGWLLVHRSGAAAPTVRMEDWPHAVAQPVGQAFEEFLDALAPAGWSDARLLDTAWVLAPDAVQETLGLPGAADPQHIVLRRHLGFRRAIEVDTGLGAILGACDGELALGSLVAAVADLLDVAATDLAATALPRLRELIVEGWLQPVTR